MRQRDETNFMEGKWHCSECGNLNSLEHDNTCPHCKTQESSGKED